MDIAKTIIKARFDIMSPEEKKQIIKHKTIAAISRYIEHHDKMPEVIKISRILNLYFTEELGIEIIIKDFKIPDLYAIVVGKNENASKEIL